MAMASISQLLITSKAANFYSSSSISTRSQTSINGAGAVVPEFRASPISCINDVCDGSDHTNSESRTNRRNVLIGLSGGLYGAAAAVAPKAHGAPVTVDDISNCHLTHLPAVDTPVNCCPPASSHITDFVLPSRWSPLRVRPAAHLVDDSYAAKFERAVALMRELPQDDPRNLLQQANAHCAYCDGAYDHAGFKNVELKIHNCWFFFPWHRCFLYFFERILGKLIGDEHFGLPFWNWDAPEGMTMPEILMNPQSSLYNAMRERKHLPPAVIDLDFAGEDVPYTNEQKIDHNLKLMYRQMISSSRPAQLFLGYPYRAGDDPTPGSGSIENAPHGQTHQWTGDSNQPNREDMGVFYSAARDPIFYLHHANIDRMWSIWKTLGGGRRDFADPDWLDASFLFYDENAELVRIKVRDCVDSVGLRYKYQDVELKWLNARPTATRGLKSVSKNGFISTRFPASLDGAVSAVVKRPKVSRSRREKEAAEEVLVIEGIEFEPDSFTKIDVYVNATEYEKVGPGGREFAGSYVNVPHRHVVGRKKEQKLKTRLRLGLCELLEDLKVEGDESVLVTLVPATTGKGKVTVDSVKIELVQV